MLGIIERTWLAMTSSTSGLSRVSSVENRLTTRSESRPRETDGDVEQPRSRSDALVFRMLGLVHLATDSGS
jgi:hypothetical protein